MQTRTGLDSPSLLRTIYTGVNCGHELEATPTLCYGQFGTRAPCVAGIGGRNLIGGHGGD